MRLDRYLAEAGIGTRSEVKKIIAKGRVTVNGSPVRDPSGKIGETSRICLDGKELSVSRYEYYMLYKPAGIISASRVNTLQRGVSVPAGEERYAVDLIRGSGKTDLFPAGRLDKDTEGLLLITNDGALAHRLLSPKFHVAKTYYAELSEAPGEEEIGELRRGTDIGDEKPTKPCGIEMISDTALYITLTEGRYHQIKRMFGKYGQEVIFLKRLRFGPLTLDEALRPGEYRKLSDEEIEALKQQ